MDMEHDVETTLRNKGFNVSTGSFGKPYHAKRRNERDALILHPIYESGSYMPEFYAEHEVVVIDNTYLNPIAKPAGETEPMRYSDGSVISAVAPLGYIDPRPVSMMRCLDDFDRILQHGGAFVMFAGPRTNVYGHETWSSASDSFRRNEVVAKIFGDELNTWSFLTCTQSRIRCSVTAPGKGIEIEPNRGIFARLLEKYVERTTFQMTLDHSTANAENFVPIARDKFGNAVAGIYLQEGGGVVFLFPNIYDKAGFLVEFMTSYLPEVRQELFPYFEGSKWVRRSEYEMPSVVNLRHQIEEIEAETNRKIEELKRQIEEKQDEFAYLDDLITATDAALVAAVQKSLKVMGFAQVVDMDHELALSGSKENKREDLQIQDKSPLILVEVKGILGLVKDKNALQVVNYIAPRMKQLERVDIRGLSVVNHQRHIPALERNSRPFNDDVIETSLKQDIGLLTTWNLYKLVRSYLKLGWTHEHVSGLFYQDGYIEAVPSHYKYVGVIENYWEKVPAVGIRIQGETLRLHDRIAFELPVEFKEQSVESLQVDHTSVESVENGQLAGVLTNLPKAQLRKGTRVFRIALP